MMITVQQTARFAKWLRSLTDRRARVIINDRIERIQMGLIGDTKSLGKGVSEIRIHYGPGYRLYYTQRGDTLVILLCGGTKSGQARDIEAARRLLEEIE